MTDQNPTYPAAYSPPERSTTSPRGPGGPPVRSEGVVAITLLTPAWAGRAVVVLGIVAAGVLVGPRLGLGVALLSFSLGVEIGHQLVVLPLFGALLFATLRYAGHAHLLKVDAPPELLAGANRRIVIAQSLYAFGALMAIVDTRLSIAIIIAVQLIYAIAPRLPLLWRL